MMKMTAAWSSPFSLAALSQQISAAKHLGFDAFAWTSSKDDEPFIRECGKKKITPVKVLAPLKKRENARLQVLDPSERDYLKTSETHQFGGEPLPGNDEILDQSLLCPLEASIVPHASQLANDAIAMGYQGICWDFVGYQNYHSCHCETCASRSKDSADDYLYEIALTDVYDKLYLAVKGGHPEVSVMAHSHPVYLPNPFFAQNAMLDYCALTVSWFFQPHWPLSKVADYAYKTKEGPYKYSFTAGMPMIGFYGTGAMKKHYKNPERMAVELKTLRNLKAKSVMVAELSNILACPEIAKTIKENLA